MLALEISIYDAVVTQTIGNVKLANARQAVLSPAHTMRFLLSVGRRDDENNCRPLILQTRQLLDRFEKRIGPTTVAWCVRVKDICRINRPATDQSQLSISALYVVFCLDITPSTFGRRKSNVAGFTRWNFSNSAGSCRSSSD